MKDLDSQIAELLGWRPLKGADRGYWINPDDGSLLKPRFTTDWRTTGPLIEKYGISLYPNTNTNDGSSWWQADNFFHKPGGAGKTPLIAVCRAVIAIETRT